MTLHVAVQKRQINTQAEHVGCVPSCVLPTQIQRKRTLAAGPHLSLKNTAQGLLRIGTGFLLNLASERLTPLTLLLVPLSLPVSVTFCGLSIP